MIERKAGAGRAAAVLQMLLLVLATACFMTAQPAAAQAASAAAATAETGAAAAYADARRAAQAGPVDLPLAGKGLLKLPEGHAFVPQPQAGRLLQAMGNPGQDPRLLGIIFPQREGEDGGWFMTVRYEDSGHIADDEAREWKADELLKNYREGTEASNEERLKMGAPAIEVLGWAEEPAYDAASHQLRWAMKSREKGAPTNEPMGVNYNTYVLGREGYFTMNLVTGLGQLPQHRPAAATMLKSLNFNEGQTYKDFNASSDRTAEYGLGALVVGVAAKKLGLLALAAGYLVKFSNLLLLGLALVGGGFAKIFKRKPKVAAVDNTLPPP